MKKSMRSGAFKASLTQFLLQEWSGKEYASRSEKRTVFVTACTQEEADTRMLLYAAHAADHAMPSVVIRSPDSDVAVIALSVGHQIDTQIIFHTRTQHRTRYLDLTAICRGLGQPMYNALPGYHVFTGCESSRAFTGRGKASASNY